MENDSKKPLLSVVVDSPSGKPKSNGLKKRFRRCQSAPSQDVPNNQNKARELIPDPTTKFHHLNTNLKQIALCLFLFLGIGTFTFYMVTDQLEGKKTNGVLDALYFVIVTMTTVGYGDLVPNSTATKLLASAFVFIGMAIVGILLSKAADYLVENQEELLVRAMHMRSKINEVELLHEMRSNRVKYKLFMTTIFLVMLVFIGTIFLWKVEKLSLVDSFYCVCSTITTLGYGDKSFSTKGGRVFAVFWIITSTICVAQFFLYVAEFNTERRQQSLAKWVLNRRMTFVDLQQADIDSDGVVDAADFLIYKLKELGKISQEDISLVLEEFENLDFDQSGTLTPSDLLHSQSGR